MGKFTPPDPRKLAPSRADPEHRGRRKELEKKHGYGYKEPLILAGIAVGLIWNIESQVEKREQRKDEDGKKEKEREERRRQRGDDQRRTGTWHPGDDRDDRGDRGAVSGYGDRRDESRRGRGGDYHRDEPRRDYRDEPRRIEYRDGEYRGYRDEYRDYHNDYRYADRRDGSLRRSSRRDSF